MLSVQITCENCGNKFTPKENRKNRRQRFCGKSCAQKWRANQPEALRRAALLGKIPMSKKSRVKLSRTLKRMGHTFSVIGGKGRGMTEPQKLLLEALGPPWVSEYTIVLGKRPSDYPRFYKADIAHVANKWIVECDGRYHQYNRRHKKTDQRRDQILLALGWKTLRLENSQILSMCSTWSLRELRTFVRKAF